MKAGLYLPLVQARPGKMDKKDYARAWIITLIYTAIAFVWLGSFSSPQTGWTPAKTGESFVVDFGKEVTVDRTMLFGGLGPAWGNFGSLEIEAFVDGSFQPFTIIDMNALFRWHFSQEVVETNKLRVTAEEQPEKADGTSSGFWQAEYRELAFFHGEALLGDFTLTEVNAATPVETLFDEQDIIPFRPNVLHGTYFDEIYFPRTALEQLLNWPVIYENTHPPMGKNIMQLGIAIFGMTPFGWRWLGTIAGALMLPLMYAMAKRLFKNSFWATFCTLFFAADFMHFTQTRIGTVDSYLVLFVMAAFHFMFSYYDECSWEKGFWSSLLPLFLSGLFLGLAGSVKWIGFFAAFGLCAMFFMSRYLEFRDYRHMLRVERLLEKDIKEKLKAWFMKYFVLTCAACLVLFIVLPITVYVLSYLPVPRHNDTRPFLSFVLASQQNMFSYHAGLTSTHPFSSSWYEWPLSLRPVFYYDAAFPSPPMDEAIAAFGNPMVWWSGLLGVFVSLTLAVSFFRYKKTLIIKGKYTTDNQAPEPDKNIFFPLIAYFSLYIPWIVSPRDLTFIYHYFPCTPFLILMAGVFYRSLENMKIMKRKGTKIVLAFTVALFFVYYPVLSGIPVNRTWLEALQILPRWDW